MGCFCRADREEQGMMTLLHWYDQYDTSFLVLLFLNTVCGGGRRRGLEIVEEVYCASTGLLLFAFQP